MDAATEKILERTRQRRLELDQELERKDSLSPKSHGLERSDSGGTKRKEPLPSTDSASKENPAKRVSTGESGGHKSLYPLDAIAQSDQPLRVHNQERAARSQERKAKFAALAAKVDNFEVELKSSVGEVKKPELSRAEQKHGIGSPRNSPSLLNVPNHNNTFTKETEPTPVAARLKHLQSVRFNDDIMSKTISTCPSTTSDRSNLDASVESSKVEDGPMDEFEDNKEGSGIETFYRRTSPQKEQKKTNLERRPSGIETFFRRKGAEESGEESIACDDSMDDATTAAADAINQIAQEAGVLATKDTIMSKAAEWSRAREAAGSGARERSPRAPANGADTPSAEEDAFPASHQCPSTEEDALSPPGPEFLASDHSPCSIHSASLHSASPHSPPSSLPDWDSLRPSSHLSSRPSLSLSTRSRRRNWALFCICTCPGAAPQLSTSEESHAEEEGKRERVGSVSDKIAALQEKANTSYRIPKPIANQREKFAFSNRPPSPAGPRAAARPVSVSGAVWGGGAECVKGTARTERVSPKKEMGIADEERRAKISALRSRWELSTAAGNALMPEQDDAQLAAVAARRFTASTPQNTRSRPLSVPAFHGGGGPWAPTSTASLHLDEPSSISCEEGDMRKALDMPSDALTTDESQEDDDEPLHQQAREEVTDETDKEDSEMEDYMNEVFGEEEEEGLEEEEPKTPASVPLVHSVSFYRDMQKQLRANSAGTPKIIVREKIDESSSVSDASARKHSGEKGGRKGGKDDEEDLQSKLVRLQAAVRVKQEQIAQASNALNVCRHTPGFKGSREEVLTSSAEAILLLKTEERKALLTEMDRVANSRREHRGVSTQPKGTLTLSHLSLPLKREFINENCNRSSPSLQYFIMLIKHREDVHETQMVNTDEALKSGRLEFPNYISLHGLQPDFKLKLELYALRTQRESMSHEEKYRLDTKKGGTLKSRPKSAALYHHGSPAGPLSILDPSFQQVGSITLTLASVPKNKFMLEGVQYSSPVEGSLRAHIRVCPESAGKVEKRGWLNAYEEVNAYGAWSRLYAVLKDGRMRFWKYQEDVHNKAALNEVELASCKNHEIKLCGKELCTRPYSFYIDVLCQIDPSDPQKMEKFRIMLAVDDDGAAKENCAGWMGSLNAALDALRVWDPKRAAHSPSLPL